MNSFIYHASQDRRSRRYQWMLASVICFACLCCGCHWAAVGHNIDGVRDYQLGSHSAAIQKFQTALATDPTNADAYYNLAAIYHELGKRDGNEEMMHQAEALYNQCLDFNPDHVDCHRGLAVLLARTDRQQSAVALLQRWAMRSNYSADARIELARLYEELGDTQAATRYLSEAINREPHNSRAWVALANIRESQGQYAQALSNYQYAYNLNRMQPGVADRIARLQKDINMGVDTLRQDGTRLVEEDGNTTSR